MKKFRTLLLTLLVLTAVVQAGTWTILNTASAPADSWAALANDGKLIKASNLGAGALLQAVKGIVFDIDYSNLTGASPTSSSWASKFYSGLDPSISNLLNTGGLTSEWSPTTRNILISGLTVGKNYRFQLLIGGDWTWCAANLYAPEYQYTSLRGSSPTLATYTWTADAATRTITINCGAGHGTAYTLAYAVHEIGTNFATNPVPANGATGIAQGNVALQWNTGMDPNNPTVPNPAITKHFVYFVENEPNFTGVVPVAVNASGATGTLNKTVQLDKTYFWRVDEGLGTNPQPGDPNKIITGSVWYFITQPSIPIITQQPQTVLLDAPGYASFTFGVSSISTVVYTWYKSGDNANNTAGDDTAVGSAATLQFNPAQTTNEGYYFCKAVNDSGETNAVYSNVVILGIKHLMAHWTLDQAKFVANQYVDETGNHNADPNNPAGVTFEAGKLGSAIAVTNSSFATAGSWRPNAYTGQMTVSGWFKVTTAPYGEGGGLISKYNDSGMDWRIWARGGDASHTGSNWVRFASLNGGDVWAGPDAYTVNEWTFVTATVNGSTARVYINGEFQRSGTWSFGTNPAAAILLGKNSPTSGLLPGSLDEIKIFNYALSDQNIAQLYYDVSGQGACITPIDAKYDRNGDCKVSMADFAELAKAWMSCGLYPTCN